MPASLKGVRVACFYPWNPFEPTGAWARFSCLWRFLLNEGAEVTLAFLDRGTDTQLKGVRVSYSGEYTLFNDLAAVARAVRAAHGMQELKYYSANELNFLLRFEKGLYLEKPKVASWLDEIVGSHDIVTCDYPMYAPLLSDVCRRRGKKLLVTSLDMLFELHGSHPLAKERLKQQEVQALSLADGLVFCNDKERQIFATYGLKGVTVLNTGDVLGVVPGDEDRKRDQVRAGLKIRTANYCLFVGSAHLPNVEAAAEVRQMAKRMPDMTFVVAGNCIPKMAEDNFIALGPVPDALLDALYRGAFCVLVPLMKGTGLSVKLFQAITYEKPVIATPVGARGYSVADGNELLIVPTPKDFPDAIRRLTVNRDLRNRIARNGRQLALSLDFRTHFKPYSTLICELLGRSASPEPGHPRSLILVDNNLSDRVGHHFNYAASLKEQCFAQDVPFSSLIKKNAAEDVLSELSAFGTFSQGIHDDSAVNPYPADWGPVRSTYDFLLSNDYFAKELEAGLEGRAASDDLIFIPNATPRQMLGLAALLHNKPIYRALQFVLILRYSIRLPSGPLSNRKSEIDKETADRYGLALDKLQRVAGEKTIRLATDSDVLAKEYQPYTEKTIEVLPIPHTSHVPMAKSFPDIPAKLPGRIRIIYLGDAREEKGFEFLPAVVRACGAPGRTPPVEFAFQSFISSHYHGRMLGVIGELEGLKSPSLHLVRKSLSPDEYHELLASADLVLLPYDAATYRGRTSGPFVEAICANKPVVVPKDSWMSAQLKDSRAGVTFASGDSQDLVRAVNVAIANLAAHREAAEKLGKVFRAYHNPENFLQHLLGVADSPAIAANSSPPVAEVTHSQNQAVLA